MAKDIPRLLLVSEASLDSQTTGLNRTLLNLFAGYPADKFMLYSPKSTCEKHPTEPPLNQNIATFSDNFLPRINNRLGFLLNPIFQLIDFQLIEWLPLAQQEKITKFSPQVVLICPNGPLGLLMGYKIFQTLQHPLIIYFMDDWVNNNYCRWLTGSVQAITSYLLNNASAWLMISTQLEEELTERYKTKPKRSLIVHNPVDLSDKQFPEFLNYSGKTFRVVYAGAIWTMHYDALAAVAEAIYELKSDGVDIELVLCTSQGFWNFYQENWKNWGVRYGSFIPYEQLNQYLQKADLLLVASSFLSKYSHITRSSVQTKLTDYMASGRPILACGPSYSACNCFIKLWNCGLVCETNKIAEIKKILLDNIQKYSTLLPLTQNSFNTLQNNFEVQKIRAELYEFIHQQVS